MCRKLDSMHICRYTEVLSALTWVFIFKVATMHSSSFISKIVCRKLDSVQISGTSICSDAGFVFKVATMHSKVPPVRSCTEDRMAGSYISICKYPERLSVCFESDMGFRFQSGDPVDQSPEDRSTLRSDVRSRF